MAFPWAALTAQFGQGFDAIVVAKQLFGERNWEALFLAAGPAPEDVVPRQVATLLQFALAKVREQSEADTEEAKERVRKHWEALRESAKKLRAQ